MNKVLPFLIVTSVLLGACNTVEGAGQDLKSAGTAVSNSAEKVKDKLNGK